MARILYLHKKAIRLLWFLCQLNEDIIFGIRWQYICLFSCLSISVWCHLRRGGLPWTPLSCQTNVDEVSGIARSCLRNLCFKEQQQQLSLFSWELHLSSIYLLNLYWLFPCPGSASSLWSHLTIWALGSCWVPSLDLLCSPFCGTMVLPLCWWGLCPTCPAVSLAPSSPSLLGQHYP